MHRGAEQRGGILEQPQAVCPPNFRPWLNTAESPDIRRNILGKMATYQHQHNKLDSQ